MKKSLTISAFFVSLSCHLTAQTAPQGNPPATNTADRAAAAWYRGGNQPIGTVPTGANIFGTLWNSPIYTYTNSLARMKLNGSLNYSVNGFNDSRSGYLLLGNNVAPNNNLFNNANFGAFSMLHIAGRDGTVVQEFGYRPWMKTGITFTDNVDLTYMGLRQLGLGYDVTETTITWSDNSNIGATGPDDMVFRFTTGTAATAGSISNDLAAVNDLDGLHIARYTGIGLMALGNTFGINEGTSIYSRPQSLLHMSYDWRAGATNEKYGFMQLTYRHAGSIIGSGETENDGLRFGIDNDIITVAGSPLMHAYLRWQENSAFVVQTDWNLIPGGVASGERLRVTTIGQPGVPQPAVNADKNITRVAVSHNGALPITEPRSLLHLGYNTGGILGASVDGWRSWMDVGTFTAQGTDNMYVGLKAEPGAPIQPDRFDAVINWGDNQDDLAGIPIGPDNLRFIFTSTTGIGAGDSISQTEDGLETGRFFPGHDEIFTYLLPDSTDFYGRFGVGDFTASGVNEDPTHKLDVIGNGRFRYLPDSLYMADSTVQKYVMVDSMGVLRWSSVGPGQFGAECSDSVNGKLQFDTKLDLNNYNLYFTKNDSLWRNHVGIGYNCGDTLPAKLSVLQTHPNTIPDSSTAISGINQDVSDVISMAFFGVKGEASGLQDPALRIDNIGGEFIAKNATGNYGVISRVDFPAVVPSPLFANNFGGYFETVGKGFNNRGIQAKAGDATGTNAGVIGSAQTSIGNISLSNVGGDFIATGAKNENYGVRGLAFGGQQIFGVYAGASAAQPGGISYALYASGGPSNPGGPTGPNYAGYFNGDVFRTGTDNFTSDENLKTNINGIVNALDIIEQLNPVSFEFDQTIHPQMNLSGGLNYGFIAQDVEPILPELVSNNVHPAQYDSTGAIIVPSVNFKSLNYQAFISIIAKGMQEQQTNIDSLETENDSLQTQISDLNARLTQLENCLSNLLPALCQANAMSVESTPEEVQETLRAVIDIELSDKNNIVLNQNVPNPFAERTVITYMIPETVVQAQIHFYDGTGKLINSVDVTERGNGQINVFASDLSTGVYTYSLVADGKIVSTKRMMKQ